MAQSDLACNAFVELVSDYLERSLPASEQARCRAHLQSCPACQTYLEQMQHTIRALSAAIDESLSPPRRAQLLQHFQTWLEAQPASPS